MSNSLVGRFEHLRNRPKSDEALPLLEKIASQVKPIMSKRSWKVGTLAEFLPANPSLLGNNMNAGQRINLRLRPPGNTSTFYEYDQLVLVMLHELTHIEHGPHDAKFYKLLGELEEEYYELKRKGYSGEGFHGSGNHLSGFRVPEYVGKAKGLAAAEQRLATQRKIGKGGVLGGRAVNAGRSMKEVLAEAAERRIRDDKACNTADAGHVREVEEEVRKAQAESEGVDAADLPSDATPAALAGSSISASDRQPPAPSPQLAVPATTERISPNSTRAVLAGKPSNLAKPAAGPSTKRPRTPPGTTSDIIDLTSSPIEADNNHYDIEWSCPSCTLLNPITTLSCEACTTPRPARQARTHAGIAGAPGWFCDFCGSGPRDMSFWSCHECGWVRKWG